MRRKARKARRSAPSTSPATTGTRTPAPTSNAARQDLLASRSTVTQDNPAPIEVVPFTTNALTGLPDEEWRSAIAQQFCPATEQEAIESGSYTSDSDKDGLGGFFRDLNNDLFHGGDNIYREDQGEGPLGGMGECGYDPETGELTDTGTLNLFHADKWFRHGVADALPGWSEQIGDAVSEHAGTGSLWKGAGG